MTVFETCAPSSTTLSPLIEQFWKVVEDYPSNIAIEDSDGKVTYAQLAADVRRVVETLQAMDIGKNCLVAVQLSPSRKLMAVLLAINSCGAGYVPLDKKSPALRNQLIVDDAEPSLLIGETDASSVSGVDFLNVAQCLGNNIAEVSEYCLEVNSDALDTVAYVIYTSGTTGVPKGVPITHGNISALFAATAEQFAFCETDVVPLSHSFAFDFSVWEIWSALGFGGTLLIPEESVRINPEKFAQLIHSSGVTILNQTPTAFSVNSQKLMKFEPDELSLRAVVFGGERLNSYKLKEWADRFGLGKPALINMYGITEITVHATSHTIDYADITSADSNIGTPLAGFKWIVEPIADGDFPQGTGELLLAGTQICNGYLKRPDITSDKFVARTLDGETGRFYCTGDLVRLDKVGSLLYMGRADEQIKMHGYRIELNEIEMVLSGYEGVEEVAVVSTSSKMIGDYLLCCYVSNSGNEAQVSNDLRNRAIARMPQYMRPLSYIRLTQFPLTVNGKIDKIAILDSLAANKAVLKSA